MSEEKNKWKKLPGILIILTTLIPSTIGIFFFHSSIVSQEEPLNPSEVTLRPPPPPNISPDQPSQNITPPPNQNVTPPENVSIPENFTYNLSSFHSRYLVEDVDIAPDFGWRALALDRYTEGGFTTSEDANTEMTSFQGEPDVNSLDVKALNVSYNTTHPLVYLQKPASSIRANNFNLESSDSQATLSIYNTPIPDNLIAYPTSSETKKVNISYNTYAHFLSKKNVKENSGTIEDTKRNAQQDQLLRQYFLQLPENYLQTHQNVTQLKNKTELSEDESVYNQVQAICNVLSSQFRITNDSAPNDVDPVSWFIAQREGLPLYFSYTLAVVLRAQHIPSRVVMGFLGGKKQPEEGTTLLSKASLGTWVEVYDSNLGWTPYNSYLHRLGLNFENIITCGLDINFRIESPHKDEGMKWAYYNETFNLSITVQGDGLAPLIGTNVSFYDLNVSEKNQFVGEVQLYRYENVAIGFLPNISFATILNKSSPSEEDYGMHTFEANVEYLDMSRYDTIALAKRSTIT